MMSLWLEKLVQTEGWNLGYQREVKKLSSQPKHLSKLDIQDTMLLSCPGSILVSVRRSFRQAEQSITT